MNRKLTLSIDGELIDAAKDYASTMDLSLSGLVAELLSRKISTNTSKNRKKKRNPIVERLSGIVDLDDPAIKNDDRAQYLLRKYR